MVTRSGSIKYFFKVLLTLLSCRDKPQALILTAMLFSSSGGHSNYVEHKRMINSTMTVCCQIKRKQSLKKHLQDRHHKEKAKKHRDGSCQGKSGKETCDGSKILRQAPLSPPPLHKEDTQLLPPVGVIPGYRLLEYKKTAS